MKIILAVFLLLFTSLLLGCQGIHSPSAEQTQPSESAVASHEAYVARVQATSALPDTLAGAAYLTYVAHARAANAGETGRSETIPPLYWAERIKQLKPVRVYTHRVNIVVVQSVSNNVESGKYIYIPISSYLPMNGDDGFVFNPNPKKGKAYRVHEVLDFTRPTGN